MATQCHLSILLWTLLISWLLLSTLSTQHGEASSSNLASSIMIKNRRLAVILSRPTKGVGSHPVAGKMRALSDKMTHNASLGRSNLVKNSESVTIGIFHTVDAEMSTQASSTLSEQPQQLQLCEYQVVIETGNQDGAGTDSDISLRLADRDGDEVYFRNLANGHRTFERGHEDTFVSRDKPCVFDICRMVLYTDDYGLFSEWFVVSLKFSAAILDNDGLVRPIVQERRWEINEWLPKNKDELFTIRDDCDRTDQLN